MQNEQGKESEALEFVVSRIKTQAPLAFEDSPIRWPQVESTESACSTDACRLEAQPQRTSIWSRRRLGIVAIAASLLVVVGLTSNPWLDPTARAFGQVREALDNAKSVVFNLVTYSDEKTLQSVTLFYRAPDQVRMESGLSLHILNGQSAEYLTVSHAERSAKIEPVYNLDALRRSVFQIFDKLSVMKAVEGTRMKELTENGKSCIEFKAVFDGDIATVLVDKETMLPIRLEVARGKINGESRREVISDFAFNQDLDAGLFAVEAPAGYAVNRVERVELDTSTSNYVVSVEEGMGPIRFGMSLNEVVNLLGEPESFESKPGMTAELDERGKPVILPGKGFKLIPADPPYDVAMLTYASRGFRISISSIDGVTNIDCFDAQAYGPSSRKFLGKTTHGVEIGMTKEEAKRLLPEAKERGPILNCNGMSIELLDGKCRAIRVNAVSKKGTNATPQQ